MIESISIHVRSDKSVSVVATEHIALGFDTVYESYGVQTKEMFVLSIKLVSVALRMYPMGESPYLRWGDVVFRMTMIFMPNLTQS